jgi:hypothetical protein
LQGLHAAHRGTDDRLQAGNSELPGQQAVLALHHVADRKARETHPRLVFAVRWGGRETVGDGIGCDNEVMRGIESLARPDQEIEPVVIAGQGNADQHGIRFLAVELAVRDVGLAVVAQDFPRLQLEITKRRHAVLRVYVPCRQRRMSKAIHCLHPTQRHRGHRERPITFS